MGVICAATFVVKFASTSLSSPKVFQPHNPYRKCDYRLRNLRKSRAVSNSTPLPQFLKCLNRINATSYAPVHELGDIDTALPDLALVDEDVGYPEFGR
jgi:hypothetical protein